MLLAQAEGSFVGIDYGTTKYDPEATTTGDFDDKDRGYVVVVGNRFKNGVGFEFNYADLGDFSIDFDQNDTISIDDMTADSSEPNRGVLQVGYLRITASGYIQADFLYARRVSCLFNIYLNQ